MVGRLPHGRRRGSSARAPSLAPVGRRSVRRGDLGGHGAWRGGARSHPAHGLIDAVALVQVNTRTVEVYTHI
jgi:hypothetical protein